MEQKMRIGNFEASCLLLNMVCNKIILDYPRRVAEDAGTAGWLMVLLVSVAVFVLFLIIGGLYRKFEGNDLLDVSKIAFGEVGEIIVGILIIMQFLFFVSINLRNHAEDIKVISLTSTPISIVIIIFCIGMVVSVFLGLETLSRIHVLTIPALAITFIIILSMNIRSFDINRLAPWFGFGMDAILKKGISNLSAYSELIALFLITPFLNKKSDYGGIGKYCILISGVLLVVTNLCYLLVFQYPIATEFFLPMYQMARSITIGRFLNRIEPAFIVIWATSAFLYLSSVMYFMIYIFKRIFHLKYEKPLIFPFIILIFTLSMVPENLYSTLEVEVSILRGNSWLLTFLIPILVFTFASFRMRKKKEVTAK